MEIKVRSSKLSAIIGLIVIMAVVYVCMRFGIAKRYEEIEKEKDYQYVEAVVIDTEMREYRDEEGRLEHSYSAVLQFQYLRDIAEIQTGYRFDACPNIGEVIPILVKKGDVLEFEHRLAKKDWLTGEYMDKDLDFDAPLFIAGLFLSAAILLLVVLVPSQLAKKLCLIGSLLGAFASGIFYTIIGNVLGLMWCLLLIYIGWLVWKIIHVMKKRLGHYNKNSRATEYNENTRLLIVKEVKEGPIPEKDTVIFALMEGRGSEAAYVSCDCKKGMFTIGDKRSIDRMKLTLHSKPKRMGEYTVFDISDTAEMLLGILNEQEEKFFDFVLGLGGQEE